LIHGFNVPVKRAVEAVETDIDSIPTLVSAGARIDRGIVRVVSVDSCTDRRMCRRTMMPAKVSALLL